MIWFQVGWFNQQKDASLKMFTFTFDNEVFFDRPVYEDCWYVYTHPSKDLRHGRFRVDSCRFFAHPEDGRNFKPNEILHIEHLLRDNKECMKLEQFSIHEIRPTHYQPLARTDRRYVDVIARLRNGGHWDPKFGVAFHQLTSENPAYRLTREFVNCVVERAHQLSAKTTDEWILDDAMDSWTYDISPYSREGAAFEEYLDEVRASLYSPTNPTKWLNPVRQLYCVDGVAGMYLIDHDSDTSFHYYDYGSAVVPIPMPPRSCTWLPYYCV